MSRSHRSTQLPFVGNRWLAAGIDPACADAAKWPSAAPSIALTKAGRQSQPAQSHAESPAGCALRDTLAIACRRVGGKSP